MMGRKAVSLGAGAQKQRASFFFFHSAGPIEVDLAWLLLVSKA
jgi:hypothetical protein